MFSLSKRTEYGLIALTYLSSLRSGYLANVSEIAESLSMPKELLAKILSELAKAGMVISFSGPTGGFRLAKPAGHVTLADIIRVLERKPAIIHCVGNNCSCHRSSNCTIRTPMANVKRQVEDIFENTTLVDFMAKRNSNDRTVLGNFPEDKK